MAYVKTKTRFSTHMRVDPKNKEWIETNKPTRTAAGFLDIIINQYKINHNAQEPNPRGKGAEEQECIETMGRPEVPEAYHKEAKSARV
jgi:hypothetical protein